MKASFQAIVREMDPDEIEGYLVSKMKCWPDNLFFYSDEQLAEVDFCDRQYKELTGKSLRNKLFYNL